MRRFHRRRAISQTAIVAAEVTRMTSQRDRNASIVAMSARPSRSASRIGASEATIATRLRSRIEQSAQQRDAGSPNRDLLVVVVQGRVAHHRRRGARGHERRAAADDVGEVKSDQKGGRRHTADNHHHFRSTTPCHPTVYGLGGPASDTSQFLVGPPSARRATNASKTLGDLDQKLIAVARSSTAPPVRRKWVGLATCECSRCAPPALRAAPDRTDRRGSRGVSRRRPSRRCRRSG